MKENENGIYGVLLLYGVLLVLIAFLLKINTNKAEMDASLWFGLFGILALVGVLKHLVGRMMKKDNKIMVIFTFTTMVIVEMVTITICTMVGLSVVIKLGEQKIVSLFSTKIIIGFIVIFLLYEFTVLVSNKFLKENIYKELKRDFEEKYNMVNLITIPSTLLTFIILAKGAESPPEDILIKFFLSCCIVYVLLIHYCWRFMLNK